MGFLVKMAFKNLTRHRRRTLVTASVIAFGLLTYIIIDSFLLGMKEMSFDNIINLETGHLQITSDLYWEDRKELPLKNLIKFDKDLEEIIEQTPNLIGMAPRIKFKANLNNGIDELPITAIGVNPVRESEVFTIKDNFVAGTNLKMGQYEAVLGKRLAELMDFQLGDYLTLIFKTKAGSFNTIEAIITGILDTEHPDINDNIVFVPLDIASQALNLTGEVSEIVVRLDNNKSVENAQERLTALLAADDVELNDSEQSNPEFIVKSWHESAEGVMAMTKIGDIENQIIISLILIMAAIGIINVIILSAIERLKETGMMKAMGMKESEIIFVYMMESVWIGLIGGILGVVLGAIGVAYVVNYGIDMTMFGIMDIDYGIPIVNVLYGSWNPGAFIFVFFFGAIVAFFSSILPARWAARKDPIDAIYQR